MIDFAFNSCSSVVLLFIYLRICIRPSLDIVLSPHRTQFHLARCLAQSKHDCDLDTASN